MCCSLNCRHATPVYGSAEVLEDCWGYDADVTIMDAKKWTLQEFLGCFPEKGKKEGRDYRLSRQQMVCASPSTTPVLTLHCGNPTRTVHLPPHHPKLDNCANHLTFAFSTVIHFALYRNIYWSISTSQYTRIAYILGLGSSVSTSCTSTRHQAGYPTWKATLKSGFC